MCQAIAEGGRRCPTHRRDTITIIHMARDATLLPQDVVEGLFTELRREARHISVNEGLQNAYDELISSTDLTLELRDDAKSRRYREILADRSSDDDPAPDTLYALTQLRSAAIERSQALAEEIATIAENNGITVDVARARWDAARDAVKSDASSVTDDEWNENLQEEAFNKNLPYDKASVVAFSRISDNSEVRGERRVQHIDFSSRSSAIYSAGYNREGGRLEVIFNSNPERIYAYHSVPESTWEEINSEDSSPGRVIRTVLGNREYQYASRAESDNDAYTVRCSSCGQFASATYHQCPERAIEVSNVDASNLTPEIMASATTVLREIEEDIHEGNVSVEAVVESVIAESENPTVIEDAPEDPQESPVSVDEETHNSVVELPFDREDTIHDWLSEEEKERARAYDREIDSALIRMNELNQLEDGREEIEGGPSQDGTIRHRLAENIIDFRSRDEEDNAAIRGRYRIASFYDSNLEGTPESISDEMRRRHVPIVLENFETPPESFYDYYQQRGESSHFVSALDPEQYMITGLSYNRSRRGIRHSPTPTGPYNPTIDEYGRGHISDEERERVDREYRATADGQIERTEVDRNITLSRTHALRMLDDENQNVLEGHRVAWSGVRDVRRILGEDGGTVSAPIEYEIPSPRRLVRDEHGNTLRPSDGVNTVTGTLAVTREGENYRTVSGRHELRCTCSVYRRNYHCRHVDFVRDNGYRIARNMSRPSASNTSGSPFQAQLANRSDFQHYTEEDGTLVGRFTISNSSRRNRPVTHASNYLHSDDVNVENPSADDTHLVLTDQRSRLSLPRPGPVNTALRRAGRVEIELGAGYGHNVMAIPFRYRTERITGTLDLTRNSEGEVVVSTERARCSCGRFASAEEAGSGTCPHIQRYETIVNRYFNGFNAEDRLDPSHEHAIAEHAANIAELRVLEELEAERNLPGNAHLTDEELRANIERRVEEARVAAEERAARLEAERIRREEEYAEQRRIANLEFAERAVMTEERVRAERQQYLEAEPEFAESLERYKEYRKNQWEEVEPGYGNNMEALKADIEEAIASRESGGTNFMEAQTSGVTDGICDPEVPGHRKFGVELEFDLPGSRRERDVAISNIVRDLREAGLTEQSSISGYHSGRHSGWAKWSLENDVTVSGELVSPLLDDSEESWRQMKTALDILKRHGAKTTTRTGSHVHISSGSYLQSLAKHAELSATVQENAQVLYRAAADPSRRKHRGQRWCSPNVQTPQVDIGNDQRGMTYSDPSVDRLSLHANMVNFESSTGLSKKEHVEFRMWDGSLDLATIQRQVAASAAMTDYADRKVDEEGKFTGEGRETRQTLDVTAGSTAMSDEALQKVGNFVDKIFRRQEDRKRFIAMFGANKWA